ncbi:MAG: tyrosine--tRNA ligase [Candidatus Melainabacteria bacterium]|nr:tyrosine--tRNA ligase [Candidatus Melainabacteria bacterium]
MKTTEKTKEIPADVMAEAEELARGAEILPNGARGLAEKIMEVRAEGRVLRAKLGIDPTSSDLHLGHSVVFRKLRRFQEYGHQVVLIIGGFTAQIGDPSGRNATRPQLTREAVEEYAKTYIEQMGAILDITKTEVVNNADWLAPLTFKDLLGLASKVTVNQMLQKEAFGSRIENQQPVSMHELFYPIMQGYDSVAIKADVELGGTDQRFNILQGRELQGYYGMGTQVACLLPLLEGTDGVKKMSKSYDNYVGLKEAPKDMFGKVMRIPDNFIIKYYELTSTLTGAEIDEIKKSLESGENPMEAKRRLAAQIVRQYHGEDEAQKALNDWQTVHSERQLPTDIEEHKVESPILLFKALVETGLATGSGAAKRLVSDGGVKLDGEQTKDPNQEITLKAGESVVLQAGRRRFVKLIAK